MLYISLTFAQIHIDFDLLPDLSHTVDEMGIATVQFPGTDQEHLQEAQPVPNDVSAPKLEANSNDKRGDWSLNQDQQRGPVFRRG